MLSLHAFGGINIKLYDTYFAARVKACNTQFDQIFFVVDNRLHPVLLGLPALISARCRLLMVEGCDMMPGTSLAMMLDLSKMEQRRERAVHGLNTLAYKLIDEGPIQSSQVTWEIKSTTESEVPAEQSLQSDAQVHEPTSDLTDLSEVSQSSSTHSVSEPIPIPTMRAFESPTDEFEADKPLGILPFCPLLPPDDVKW